MIEEKSGAVVSQILDKVMAKWEISKTILSDNGLEFVNQQVIDLCKQKGSTLKHGSSYKPSTQGAIEQFN
ncbi:hypothetical protein PAEPH01_2029 [Pancytospora epiphaga]|nr:hypothetical protein PAEPH01_2029 [Pancytospora epiphaga]